MGSHAFFLQLQGADKEITTALFKADLAAAPVTDAERVLLQWVELLTLHAYKNTPEDVQRVRDAGWNEPQIAEAVYVTAMFAFFNRVADAFGLEDPDYFKNPPAAMMPK